MAQEYQNNHYVPEWYQRRFVQKGEKNQKLFYLDFAPGFDVDPTGIARQRRAIRRQGFKHCFAAKDLYTIRFGGVESRLIESHFFGEIDNAGSRAVGKFVNFSHGSVRGEAFQDLMMHMSTQKLRTFKGLEWLARQSRERRPERVLSVMTRFRHLFCAIWTECVWSISDASRSATKFIVSDHPVTVYNRGCNPRSRWCRGANDPDIRLHATHTIFPLSLEKILILTNLSWVRNPYQPETGIRPNPNPHRDALFRLLDVQILRHLSEQEVREINFIIKSRARRFIGAAQEEWLFPERHVSKDDWAGLATVTC